VKAGTRGGNAPDLARLADLVELFPQQTILVLGDFVADEFVFGEISRVSREAPVLILRHKETQFLPGGGANAANNLVDLGARVLPVGAVGDDEAGNALEEYFRSKSADISGVLRVPGWTTPTKTRFLAGWTHTGRQQVLRMDREPSGELPAAAVKSLVRLARARLTRVSAMVISDYGYGSATPAMAAAIGGRGGTRQAPVALDSRYRLHEYAGLGLRAATPNEAEIEAAHHARIAGSADQLERLARRTMARMGIAALVVTRGRDGMTVFERGRAPCALAVFGSDQAVDVTGAGDTVIAAFTVAAAAGASVLEAAQIANYAGGIVVMKRGTATVTRAELLGAIRGDATGAGTIRASQPAAKEIAAEEIAVEEIAGRRKAVRRRRPR
jgi:rfaE bifunctional protein kinase chain/domain